MKILFFLVMNFISISCLSSDDKQEILNAMNDDELFEDEKNEQLTDDDMNTISKTLNHPYFGERFSNFNGVLGIGTEGATLKVDFQLLPEHPQTIPVALKINYENLSMEEANSVENYLNLMVNAGDQNRIVQGKDLVVYDLSKHYRKMSSQDGSFKKDTPFVSMIYEAAIIMLNDSGGTKYVTVTVTQLGFSDLPGSFLPLPKSPQILNSNSENVARMIVQICYAVWRMNEQGFIHKDIHGQNVLVAGNSSHFSPMIIDFGRLINLNEFKSKAFLLKQEMINKSDPDYKKNLKLFEDVTYILGSEEAAQDFQNVPVDPSSFLTSEAQKNFSGLSEVYLVGFKYNVGNDQMVDLFKTMLETYIEEKVISESHKNIQNLQEKIYLFNDMIESKQQFTSSELFQNLNQASGLNLSGFRPENFDLDNYFDRIGNSSDSDGPRKKMKFDTGIGGRLVLV
jgi:serine/threonine protein kinase